MRHIFHSSFSFSLQSEFFSRFCQLYPQNALGCCPLLSTCSATLVWWGELTPQGTLAYAACLSWVEARDAADILQWAGQLHDSHLAPDVSSVQM